MSYAVRFAFFFLLLNHDQKRQRFGLHETASKQTKNENRVTMSTQQRGPRRDVILLVGATGSLGRPTVKELQRQGYPLRLMGRSYESFAQGGWHRSNEKKLDLVICKDTADINEYHYEWFQDVWLVISVARPRSLQPDDKLQFAPMVENLSKVACRNGVPHVLFLGLPYVGTYVLGRTSTMDMLASSEEHLKEIILQHNHNIQTNRNKTSLNIVRLAEMSKLGHMVEIAAMLHFWPVRNRMALCRIVVHSAWMEHLHLSLIVFSYYISQYVPGYNPSMQPISASDFATAVTAFATKVSSNNDDNTAGTIHYDEYLAGGPQIVTWMDFHQIACTLLGGKPLWKIPIPLVVLQAILAVCQFFSKLGMPVVSIIVVLLQIATVPMISETRCNAFTTFGMDRIEDVLRKHSETYVHDKLKQT